MEVEKMRKSAFLAFGVLALGVAVCLTGAALMAFGEGLLGENHTGIATVIGIVGIGIIGTSCQIIIASSSKKRSTETKPSTGGVLND
jgi:hypothetical protein